MSQLAHAQHFAPPSTQPHESQDLLGLSRDDLLALFAEMDEPAFRAKQLWHWMYHQGAQDFDAMTTMSKDLRVRLKEKFIISRPAISEQHISTDGTRKWLLRFADDQEAEMVFIPDGDRGTLCISSQVGCTLTCTFCHTGTQRLVRNLSPGEIVGQVMLARDALGGWPSPKEDRLLTNIVLMGMGEPLYNFDNVASAMRLVMDSSGITIGRRRITLSTSGVVPMMQRCGDELGVNLAVSLHAVRDEVRDRLVPLNKKYPIKDLLAACRAYPGVHNARRITFEYVMLKGVNDTDSDARELVRLLQGIPAKINLIPFNPWPGTQFACSSWERIEAFSDIVFEAGMSAPIRKPRGRDIMAACGQLKSASERQRASARKNPTA